MRAKKQKRLADCINRAHEIVMAKKLPIDILTTKNRQRNAFYIKRAVALTLYSEGFTYPEIGFCMDTHHTCVMRMVDEEFREKSKVTSKKNNPFYV